MTENVLLTVFAGRRRYMELLMRYARRLADFGRVREVHVWNYTRCREDDAYVRGLADPARRILVMEPRHKNNWSNYYDHYTPEEYPDHVIIKCDDDILYMDLEAFDAFVRRRRSASSPLLASASVLNNAAAARSQLEAGFFAAPGTRADIAAADLPDRIWQSGVLAQGVHEHFDAHREWWLARARALPDDANAAPLTAGVRFSINFIAFLSSDLPHIRRAYALSHDDEQALTVVLSGLLRRDSYVDLGFTVAHGAFYTQRGGPGGMDEAKVLDIYRRLADALGL
jgi:hypothetical protein